MSQQKLKRSHFFGSGSAMSQLGIKTAVPRLRPPACRAVPARRALNLRDIGVRYVGDGGRLPLVGPLPAGCRSTPVTQPPLGFLSAFLQSDLRAPATPPTSCDFNAADHSECPSAGGEHTPSSSTPSLLRTTSAEAPQKPSFWLGSAMSQLGIKTAVPQLRPPECVPLLTRGTLHLPAAFCPLSAG
jgi:hypothetical protein